MVITSLADLVKWQSQRVVEMINDICSRTIKPCPRQQQCRSNIVECYKSNNFLAKSNVASTKSNVALALLPFLATMLTFW